MEIGVDSDEAEAIDLRQRVAASDVGRQTLDRLELAVDELAIAYPMTPPDLLLLRVRRHLTYVGKLLDARKTLAEHRRLVVVGSWLSLLAATCSIDLAQRPAAAAGSVRRHNLPTTANTQNSPPGVSKPRRGMQSLMAITGAPSNSAKAPRRSPHTTVRRTSKPPLKRAEPMPA